MEPYKSMYTLLFNRISELIEELREVQLQAEEVHVLHEQMLLLKDYRSQHEQKEDAPRKPIS